MKTKIIALMMAVFCLSMCFVGCDKACETHVDENNDGICDVCETEIPVPPCETHTDADKNQECDVCKAKVIAACDVHKDDDADKICDVCQRAIVVLEIKDDTKPERVDMVVNAIPEGVEIGKYVELKDESATAITTATKIAGEIEDVTDDAKFLLLADRLDGVTTYTVYDSMNGKSIKSVSDQYFGTAIDGRKQVFVQLYNEYFTVETAISEDGIAVTRTKEYYTYAGKMIHSINWNYDSTGEGILWNDYLNENDATIEFKPAYKTIWTKDTVYAIDSETRELVYSSKPSEFVYRPSFNITTEKYGYVEYEETVFVYDLTKWVNCVASYQIPSYYTNRNWAVLENGNVLIYAAVILPDDAISYDFIQEGNKYDLVYTILNVAEKSVTNVEFGYSIDSKVDAENGYTAQALNVFKVYPIVNDKIDTTAPKTLVVDNVLQVLYDSTATTVDADYYLVADGLFLKTTNLDDETFIREIVNEKGERVAYVPINADVRENYIVYNSAIYNFKMEKILDLVDANDYALEDEFIIVEKYTDDGYFYYYYDVVATVLTPVEITGEGIMDVITCEFGFAVSYQVDNDGAFELKHKLFNADNQFVCDLDCENEYIGSMQTVRMDEDSDIFVIAVNAYSIYYYTVK